MHLKQHIKDSIARFLASCLTEKVRGFLCHEPYFSLWEKQGIHITPVHFYQPIPDKGTLENYPWNQASEMTGVDMNEGFQLNLLADFSRKHKSEYEAFPRFAPPDSDRFLLTSALLNR